MSVEPFVLLPFNKWKAMDEELRKKSNGEMKTEWSANKSDITAKPEHVEYEQKVTKLPEPKLSKLPELGKDLTSQQSAANIRKQVEYLKTMHGGAFEDIDNLDELVKNAVSNSKREVQNEQRFYDFLFKHSLGGFVRNRHKIEKYFKSPWYLI